MKKYELPTGYLFTDDYSRGQLETLSIGDYGKQHNVKANFLGITRPLEGVSNVPCKPLSEKWVITLSTQHGCPMKCNFCDVPKVKFGGNVMLADLKKQLFSAIEMFPEVKYTDRLNVHFARMGEPVFNGAVLDFAEWMYEHKARTIFEETGLRIETLHPVFTTSMPVNFNSVASRLHRWCEIKNDLYNGQAGLQLSINSTDEAQREKMFGGTSMSLLAIARIAANLPAPKGRKYCLNFAYATGSIVDPVFLKSLFDPEKFMVKITPIHNNNACTENGITTVGGYSSFTPYAELEQGLIDAGFDVLVFVPSMDEENGLVTCGNAVLGGSQFGAVGSLNIEGEKR